MKRVSGKRFVRVLAVLAVMFTAAFAAWPATAADTPDLSSFKVPGAENQTYYINVFLTGVEFWKGVYDGFKAAADQLGVKVEYGGTPEYDAALQVTSFEQMLAKKPAGICTHPISETNLTDSIDKAAELGVPVATMYIDAPDSARIGFWGTDTTIEGEYAADLLVKAIGESGEIVIIERPQENVARRITAFKAKLEKSYPNIKIVASGFAEGDQTKATELTAQMLQAHPNIKGMVAFSAVEAVGAIVAKEETGSDMAIITYELEPAVIDAIKEGKVYATIGHDSFSNGYWSLVALYCAHNKLNNSYTNDWSLKRAYTPTPLINIFDNLVVTKENVDHIKTPEW
ncbi:MAG: substrate-binding domain-containing protein [Synergistaceae bacterium]|nr:substrate-binding domain-containing protein [Synergistaceae bacterium]